KSHGRVRSLKLLLDSAPKFCHFLPRLVQLTSDPVNRVGVDHSLHGLVQSVDSFPCLIESFVEFFKFPWIFNSSSCLGESLPASIVFEGDLDERVDGLFKRQL